MAVYELVKRNRASRNPITFATTTEGDARSRGLEVDAIGQVSAQLALIGSYTYLDAKVTRDGQDPAAQGKRLANTARNAGYRFHARALIRG